MNNSAIQQVSDRNKAILTSGGTYAAQGAVLGATIGGPWGAVIGGLGYGAYGAFKGRDDYDDNQKKIAAETAKAMEAAAVVKRNDQIASYNETQAVKAKAKVFASPADAPDIKGITPERTGNITSALGQIRGSSRKSLSPIIGGNASGKDRVSERQRFNKFNSLAMSGIGGEEKSGILQNNDKDWWNGNKNTNKTLGTFTLDFRAGENSGANIGEGSGEVKPDVTVGIGPDGKEMPNEKRLKASF